MKAIIIFSVIFCFGIILSHNPIIAQDGNNDDKVKIDSLNLPFIVVEPPEFEVPKPDGRFITRELKVFNKGAGTLIITKVTAGCYCGMSTVLNSGIAPADTGKIMLYVNLDGTHGNNIMTYTIYSNAKNSPTIVTLTILPPEEPKYPQN